MGWIDRIMTWLGMVDDRIRPPVYPWEDGYNYEDSSKSSQEPSSYFPPGEISGDELEEAIRSIPTHYVGISTVTATISTEFKWTVGNTLTGASYNQTQNSGDIKKSYAFGTAAGNGVTGGGDEVFSFQQTIAAGSSATIDLNAMTNLLQQTSIAITQIKGFQLRVLSGTDDATISPTPTATSAVTVSNEGLTVPCQLDFGNGGSGLTLTLTTSTGAITSVAIGAAGSGYPKSNTFLVTPNQASGSGALVAVTTNSSGVPTTVALVAGTGGSGYSDATVPTTVVGHYKVLTGGAHMYFDPSATGFCVVSATAKNVKVYNLDGSNAVTIEVDVLGTTTN